MYTLYEFNQDDIKIGLIISEKEQCLYIGNKLYSARTNTSPDKNILNSDITGRGLVKVELDPLKVTIAGQEVEPAYKHEEPEKYNILQHWYSRLRT